MNGSLAIREARAEDADAIVAMLWEFAQFEKLTHIRLTSEILVKDFVGPERRVQCEIAEWEGTPAGLMIWFRGYATFAAAPVFFIEDIFVRPDFRRRGIAKALIKHLARLAIKEDVKRIDWIVLDWNGRAIEFYESIGAPILKDWRTCRLDGAALTALAHA